MKRLIIIIIALFWYSNAIAAVDGLLDFENGNNGDTVTSTILDNATHGTGLGSWNWTPLGGTNATITTDSSSNAGVVKVGGDSYSGGTRGCVYDHSAATAGMLEIYADTGHDSISVGFDLTFGPHDSAVLQNYDLFTIGDWEGSCGCTLSYYSETGNNRISAHTAGEGITNQHGDYIAIDYTKPYYVTMKWVRNDKCYINIYNKSDMSLAGTSSNPVLNTAARYFRFGAGGYGANTSGLTKWDNIMWDWTDATFPLLPIFNNHTLGSGPQFSIGLGATVTIQ